MQPDRELIVVDNASLDETYRYLGQLQKDRFMKHPGDYQHGEQGFCSLGESGDGCRTRRICFRHAHGCYHARRCARITGRFDGYFRLITDVMGPVSGVSFNPEQRMHQPESDPESLRYADYADSFRHAHTSWLSCPLR